MRILMVSAEGPPLRRRSDLIDVMGMLPSELREAGHEISLVLPYYQEIREDTSVSAKDTGITVDVRLGDESYVAEYLEGRTGRGVQLFLVRCDEFFDRAGIYGEGGKDYEDNAARFVFFAKAVIELARRLTPAVQILHVHDWAPALVPVLVHAHQLPFSTVLTIHHVEEQGSFWGLDFKLTNLHERFFTLRGVEFFGRMNLLKGGILYADRLTTVSEWYRRQILSAEGGAGLDAVLRENAYKLRAALNGVDYAQWSPENDPELLAHYSSAELSGKKLNRDALLSEFSLLPGPRGPVFAMRATPGGGLNLLGPLLDRLLSDDVRLIVLGEVEREFETTMAIMARKFQGKFVYQKECEESAAHLLKAGSDITLLPSRLEASGADAIESLKYGSLPVALAGAGIQEIIEDWDPTTDSGYGFLCYLPSAEAFWDAIKRASADFRDRGLWEKLMVRAMECDFSWAKSVARYEEIYRELVGTRADAAA
jgi:starch synthase